MPLSIVRLSVALFLLSFAGAYAQDVQKYPDIVEASIESAGDNRFHISATVSSPYDSPDRYADAFRVVTPDGDILGVRELLHHHANEQPFTRSLRNVHIPGEVDRVIIQGRDQEYGYGGETVTVEIP